MIKGLDSTVNLSEEMKAYLLLECANLSRTERMMVMSSIGNKREWKLITEAMRNVKMEAGSSVDLLSDSIAKNPGTGRVIFQSERLS